MSKEQEELEKEVEEEKEKSVTIEEKIVKLQNLLKERREYIDVMILNGYNISEIQDMFELTYEQAKNTYSIITDQYVRIWFKTGKMEIIHKV